jgi:hypothetical protein
MGVKVGNVPVGWMVGKGGRGGRQPEREKRAIPMEVKTRKSLIRNFILCPFRVTAKKVP